MQEPMYEIVNAFFQVTIERFQFLIEKFRFGKGTKRSNGGVYRVIYQNKVIAVEIGLEWREQYIYVELFRLINGKIRENPIIIQPDSSLTAYNLEDLLAIRAPEQKLNQEYFHKPLNIKSVECVLTHYAHALQEFGEDVLLGDLAIFTELEAVVKARIQTYPLTEEIAVEDQSVSPLEKQKMKSRLVENERPPLNAIVPEGRIRSLLSQFDPKLNVVLFNHKMEEVIVLRGNTPECIFDELSGFPDSMTCWEKMSPPVREFLFKENGFSQENKLPETCLYCEGGPSHFAFKVFGPRGKPIAGLFIGPVLRSNHEREDYEMVRVSCRGAGGHNNDQQLIKLIAKRPWLSDDEIELLRKQATEVTGILADEYSKIVLQ
jgi:hypothetical protein